MSINLPAYILLHNMFSLREFAYHNLLNDIAELLLDDSAVWFFIIKNYNDSDKACFLWEKLSGSVALFMTFLRISFSNRNCCCQMSTIFFVSSAEPWKLRGKKESRAEIEVF